MINKEQFIYLLDETPLPIPKRSECETCIHGTPFCCPNSDVMRTHYFRINTPNPIKVDILQRGLPELVESAIDCPTYIEDPKFKDRNMD